LKNGNNRKRGVNILEKTKKTRKPRNKKGATVERVFTVTEVFEGQLKLSDIFAELLYAAYCREQQNVR
jgi:hypothetical protein